MGNEGIVLNRLESIIQYSSDSEKQMDEAGDLATMMSASTILDQDFSRHQLIFQCFYESLTEDFGIKMDQEDLEAYANQVDAPVNAAHITGTSLIFVINLDHIMLFDVSMLNPDNRRIKPLYSVKIDDLDSYEKAWEHLNKIVTTIKEH